MMKIGVFDSGIGGITVLSEMRRRFPTEDFVYLGDTAHVPYGTKSPSQVVRLSLNCARILKEKKIDALVVACNTASSLAIDVIRDEMNPIPVYGMVEPGVEAVIHTLEQLNESHSLPIQDPFPILVLATRATIRSGTYGKKLKTRLLEVPSSSPLFRFSEAVVEQACPLLVPLIEEGWINDHPILALTLAEYVKPYSNHSKGIALLGCTHYPWIKSAFQKALLGWTIVDSASAVTTAFEQSSLFHSGLQARVDLPANPGQKPGISPTSITPPKTSGSVEWIFTDPDAVPEFALQLIETIQR